MNDLEALKTAREYFAENGGAHYTFQDIHERVCALGAVNMVIWGQAHPRYTNDNPSTGYMHYCASDTIRKALSDASFELYGEYETPVGVMQKAEIEYVNDDIGKDAVLTVYDHVIKQWEEEK